MKTLAVLVLVVFLEGEPVNGGASGFDTLANCEAARADMAKRAKAIDADVFLKCFEVEHEAAKPKPEKPAPQRGSAS